MEFKLPTTILSLEKVKLPDWKCFDLPSQEFIEDVWKLMLEEKVFEEHNKVHRHINNTFCKMTMHSYPGYNRKQLISCTLLIMLYTCFDEKMDAEKDPVEREKFAKRCKSILLTGKLPEDPFYMDHLWLRLLNDLKENCKGRPGALNRTIRGHIYYIESISPFLNLKEYNGCLHMDLYFFIRIADMGIEGPSQMLEVFLDQQSVLGDRFFCDARYNDMIKAATKLYAIINDICSYEKEFCEGNFNINPLFCIQKQENKSFEEAFNKMVEYFNESVESFQQLEAMIREDMKQMLTEKEYEKVDEFFYHLHSSLIQYRKWMFYESHYRSPTSPFKELRQESLLKHSKLDFGTVDDMNTKTSSNLQTNL
ncbi:hypothetical protein PPL_02989 [Heterostelium album PN500]|uniref:Terpene synthase n=1 Tax=Heterostelium pallidum (strain ATCC 26659 / Pp 5 / PN500) TaxID=670386 RepID=D3B3M1_HETP5|nr:hypothetical protein PPL_02989 [Heterostelium album PN500]EFA83919.1 hypothetical protein PPL_02989 [Heterostelium album PN500]|eukprot:XP_020436036.1 hypothetical protein PPL_02989 [Heterostelium album PN500]